MNKAWLPWIVLLSAFVGFAYGRWTMLWWDIDEYHTLRMEFEEKLEELNKALDK